ncbi:MAG: hypothetical protein ACPGWR_32490, partial [Ardenticatenaceae bacterium]
TLPKWNSYLIAISKRKELAMTIPEVTGPISKSLGPPLILTDVLQMASSPLTNLLAQVGLGRAIYFQAYANKQALYA